jgi:hypothetical protein
MSYEVPWFSGSHSLLAAASSLQRYVPRIVLKIKICIPRPNFNLLECLGTIRIDYDLTRNLGTFVSKHKRAQRIVCGRHVGGIVRYAGTKIIFLIRKLLQIIGTGGQDSDYWQFDL